MTLRRRGEDDRPCFRCMASIPCGSLIGWIILITGLGGFTASLLIGINRTRDMQAILFDNRDLLPAYGNVGSFLLEEIVIAICVSMVIIGTFFLVIASLSSGSNSRHVFGTARKNSFGRALNILVLVMAYVFNFFWALISCALIVPVVLLALLRVLYEHYQVECINLRHYGFEPDQDICGTKLERLWVQGKETLLCYATAWVSAILVTLSMGHFMAAIGSNLRHLKETRFSAYNTYKDEINRSTNSILETKM